MAQTHLRLELGKLKTAAVELEQLVLLGWFSCLVGYRRGLDRGSRLSLLSESGQDQSACRVFVVILKSFRSPCNSCISRRSWPLLCSRSPHSSPALTGVSQHLHQYHSSRVSKKRSTHITVYANMVGMRFPTRGTLDLEHIPEGIVLRIVWSQVCDS